MKIEKKKVKRMIVTGANGFVGSAVVKELLANGIAVYAVVRTETKNVEELEKRGAKVIYCDMANYASLPEKIDDLEFDAFYHFAWTGSSGELRGNEKIQLQNVEFACMAVRVARALKCQKFIFASSIMEYEVMALMSSEKEPPISTMYCTAKITANYMCRTLASALGMEYMAGLISNIYGPGETSPRLINTSIRKLLKGEHVSYSPGEQLYDFIYITDAAKMFVKMGIAGKGNKTYYIGNRYQRKLKDFLLEMKNIVAPDIEIGLGEIQFSGVSLSYKEFDTQAVYTDMMFQPEVSFAQGIRNTMEWIISTEKGGE